jgi:hypothetical protein
VSEEHDDLSAADEALHTIREELRVEPSPQLAADVRARIAGRRIGSRRLRWILPMAAALVLAAGGALVLLRDRPGHVSRATDAAPSAKPPSPAVEPIAPASEIEPATPARNVKPAAAATASVPIRAGIRPEIRPVQAIVPAGEEARIARYAESVRQRPFEADTLAESDPRELLTDPAPIEIAPLKTAPLVPDEGSLR